MLVNIVPIPKPNKDVNKGISYRPISLLSINAPTQDGYTHYTLNNTVAKGFNQMAPPARTIIVALDMSKDFDTLNIHTLIR